jgi:hypothetical protein
MKMRLAFAPSVMNILSAFSFIAKLSYDEKDHGRALVWQCHRCGDLQDFHFITGVGQFKLFGMPFNAPHKVAYVRCKKCSYDVKIAPEESPLAETMRDCTERLAQGSLTAATYKKEIEAIPAHFLAEIRAVSENWTCPSCNEENPMGFVECWSCHKPMPGAEDLVAAAEAQAKERDALEDAGQDKGTEGLGKK